MEYIKLDDFMGSDYSNWIFDRVILPTGDDASTINLMYSGHSGDKYVSPLCLKVNNGRNVAIDATKDTLANLIRARYMPQWKRIYDALFSEYNPINNYELKETETINTTGSGTSKSSSTNSATGKDASSGTNGTDTTTTTTGSNSSKADTTESTTNEVYGYDSETGVKDSSSSSTSSTTSSGNNEGTSTVKGTDTSSSTNESSSSSTGEINGETTSANDSSRTLNKSGNIGVTTSQQMIESELQLRRNNYYDIIFKDVDSLLCLRIY